MPQPLSALFVNHAADVLAETSNGLSGTEIVRALGAYALDFNVEIPHPTYPFDAPNKRTALAQNLMAFSEPQRYRIIRDLCDHQSSQFRNADGSLTSVRSGSGWNPAAMPSAGIKCCVNAAKPPVGPRAPSWFNSSCNRPVIS